MFKAPSLLKALVLSSFLGNFSAQAVPVVFTGQIDIDPSAPYFIDFGINDGNPETTFYELFWDGQALSDSTFNFDQVISTGGLGWNFVFTHDVIGTTFDLDFSQNVEKFDQALFFSLVPDDPSVVVTVNASAYLTISGFQASNSYLANIQAIDPFIGTLAINAMGGAPELDPRSSTLPALFMFGALLATRRRRQPHLREMI